MKKYLMLPTYLFFAPLLIALLLIPGTGAAANASTGITITDPALQVCLRDKLRLKDGAVLNDESLQRIQRLNCNDRPGMATADLEQLLQLPKLMSLNLSNTGIKDLSVLEKFNGLQVLFLSGNHLNDTDVAVLSALPQLKTLVLAQNQLKETVLFSTMPKLEELDLAHNRIQDARPLESQASLLWLDLSNNCLGTLPSFDFVDAFMCEQAKPEHCQADKDKD